MSEYSVLAKLILDTSNVNKELKKIRTLPVKAKLQDGQAIDNQIKRWNDSLIKMEHLKPDVFSKSDVKTEVALFKNMEEGFRTGTVSADAMRTQMSAVNREYSKASSLAQQHIKDGDNIFRATSKNVAKVAEWAIATGLLYGAMKQLQDGTKYIKDLNKEMTNIGLVTGQTAEQLSGLSVELNSKAKELGVTTLDTARGYVEWARQGRTAAESMTLLENSTKLAKLGNLDAADATTKLTSAINAYGISVEDSIRVVDVLVRLDQEFSTSTAEIADAMEESSSMARQAGIDYQNLASYITIISSITRQSGDTIGNALKSISARMLSVKAGVDFDEQGESVNNVEKVLRKYDIALRDTANSFRDLDDVLADAAKKYNELGAAGDTVAQGQITSALAG